MDAQTLSSMYETCSSYFKPQDNLYANLCFRADLVPPFVKCQESVGQAPNFEVDAYMECYAHGYPAPRLSWYKEVDPNNPTALTLLTEKSFKYKFEATIPEPDVCTDCILARITVINVISGDYGTYVLRASSEQQVGYHSEGRVKLYRMSSFSRLAVHLRLVMFKLLFSFFLQKLPSANNPSPIQTTRVAAVRRERSNSLLPLESSNRRGEIQ